MCDPGISTSYLDDSILLLNARKWANLASLNDVSCSGIVLLNQNSQLTTVSVK